MGQGARRDLTSSSFPVSRCGAPRISVTSVPLAPPSARSACPQGARRIRKTAEPPTAAQSLRAAWAVVAACAGGRTRASAPTGLVAFVTLARSDTQVGPHKMRKADGISVGADAFIGPLRQFPRGAASGSEKRSSSMRQPPRRGRRHPPRDGSIDLTEGPSVPEGGPKSALAPIRRPPSARRATAPQRATHFSL